MYNNTIIKTECHFVCECSHYQDYRELLLTLSALGPSDSASDSDVYRGKILTSLDVRLRRSKDDPRTELNKL